MRPGPSQPAAPCAGVVIHHSRQRNTHWHLRTSVPTSGATFLPHTHILEPSPMRQCYPQTYHLLSPIPGWRPWKTQHPAPSPLSGSVRLAPNSCQPQIARAHARAHTCQPQNARTRTRACTHMHTCKPQNARTRARTHMHTHSPRPSPPQGKVDKSVLEAAQRAAEESAAAGVPTEVVTRRAVAVRQGHLLARWGGGGGERQPLLLRACVPACATPGAGWGRACWGWLGVYIACEQAGSLQSWPPPCEPCCIPCTPAPAAPRACSPALQRQALPRAAVDRPCNSYSSPPAALGVCSPSLQRQALPAAGHPDFFWPCPVDH